MPRLYDTNGQPTGCRGPRWYLRFIDQLQAQLDINEPERDFYCRYCRAYHVVKADRLVSVSADNQPRRYHRRPSAPVKPNWCAEHRTSATWLTTRCAFCGAVDGVHLHLGRVARGQNVNEPCISCRRLNRVRVSPALKAWQLKGKDRASGLVTAMRPDGGKVATQLELVP